MLRRRLAPLLAGIVAWCAVTAVDDLAATSAGPASWASGTEHAVLSHTARPQPRLGGWLLAIGTEIPALPAPRATPAPSPEGTASRIDSPRSSPRSSRGPPG